MFEQNDFLTRENVLVEGNNGVFANPIAINNITSNPTTDRLKNIKNKSLLPFPFIFSPSRKNALNFLLPLPSHLLTVIEGFYQDGKSNFACNLSLIYKLHPFNYAVIYISNMGLFNEKPCEYVFAELFSWFYEEIAESAFIRNVLEHYLDNGLENIDLENQINILSYILDQLKSICHKKIIVLVDQVDLLKGNAAEQILNILLRISERNIFVTTNTKDQTEFLENERRKDGNNVMTIVLDEKEHPISKEELMKVVIKLFFKENDQSMEKFDFAELLCNKTQNNLFLIFLFYNHHRGEVSLETLLEKYESFAKAYIAENLAKHEKWSEEYCFSDELKMKELTIKTQVKIIFLNYDQEMSIEDESLLDKRYLYLFNGRLKSINPLITKMVQDHYGMVSFIENFLNENGPYLNPKLFGSLFNFYMREKCMQAHSSQRLFELKIENYLGNQFTISVCPKVVKNVHYGKKCNPKKAADCEGLTANQCITFEPITTVMNTLFKTEQSNFPFFDLCYFDELQHIHNMINFKTNGKFMEIEEEFWDKFEDYFDVYGKQAQKQIDRNLIIFF